MIKIRKIIVISVVSFFIVHILYINFRYGYSANWELCKNYTFLFKKNVINDIYFINPEHRNSICHTTFSKYDILSAFYYHPKQKAGYNIIWIWDLQNLRNLNLNQITIKKNIYLNSKKIWLSGVIEGGGSKGYMPLTVEYGFNFKHHINVNLNEFSKIDGFFSGKNFKGFYGIFDQISFSDERNKHQIFFGGNHSINLLDWNIDAHELAHKPMLFVFYKGHQSFYIITVFNYEPFKDASILKIFNFD